MLLSVSQNYLLKFVVIQFVVRFFLWNLFHLMHIENQMRMNCVLRSLLVTLFKIGFNFVYITGTC